ncbi:MAG: chemotaxis protein CheW [bacterium]|nr:chemotaxis protein CheW [bacterium]
MRAEGATEVSAAASAPTSETPASGEGAPPATPAPAAVSLSPTVRVRTDTLDRFLSAVGEVILSSSQLRTGVARYASDPEVADGFDRVDRRVAELQRRVLDLRTAPLVRVTDNLPRTARQVAEKLGKRVEVEIIGAELELDRSILDRLGEPLLHLLRNAVDHGLEMPDDRRAAGKPETGAIRVEARRQKDSIEIDVSDDGKGLDLASVCRRAIEAGLIHPDLVDDLPIEEIAAFVFHPGLSTAQSVTDVSGRGVGMDAVKATVESLGGGVELRSEVGVGTTTTLVVPITAAVQRVLVVGIGEERVAIPIGKVERILEVPRESIEEAAGDTFALVDDEPLPVFDLAQALRIEGEAPDSASVPIVLSEIRGERVALRVARFAGQQEFYVKPVPELLAKVRILSGLTVLDDGSPVFLLDLNQLGAA